MFCSTSNIVMPWSLRSPMISSICRTIYGASPSVGSSSKSSSGSAVRARPMASICCSPPERIEPSLCSRSASFSNMSSTSSTDGPPLLSTPIRPISMFSRTVNSGKIRRFSGTNASPSRIVSSVFIVVISVSSKMIVPPVGVTLPTIDWSVVVLPTPLRPTRETTLRLSTSSVTPCRTSVIP